MCMYFIILYTEITAATAQAVVSAKTRIEILIDSVRHQLPWTHFVSIPLNTDDFIKQFELFKVQVMEHASNIKVSYLHTLDVLNFNSRLGIVTNCCTSQTFECA